MRAGSSDAPRGRPRPGAAWARRAAGLAPLPLALLLLAALLQARGAAAARALRETGDVMVAAKLTTDPAGGAPPLGKRVGAWDAARGARIAAVNAEARCKARGRGGGGTVRAVPCHLSSPAAHGGAPTRAQAPLAYPS
jgi:hypothetical protein